MHDGDPGLPAPAPAVRERCYLGFDFGTQRIGVAAGNTVTGSASALTTLRSEPVHQRFDAMARLIGEWQPAGLVVGIPRHPDGTPHDMTRRAERFARQLEGRFRLPVHEVDERYTSVEAEAAGARDVDAASAALILEQFLRDPP